MGHEVHVLTQNPAYPFGVIYENYRNRLFQITNWGKIKIYRVYTVQKFNVTLLRKVLNYLMFPVLGSIRAVTIGRRYDRIFVYQVGPLTQTLPAIVAKWFFRKKVVLWSFDIWPDTVYSYGFRKGKILEVLLNHLVRFIYRYCDLIAVPSRAFNQVYAKYTEEQKLKYIPSWCIKSEFSQIAENEKVMPKFQGRINFTFAGNIGRAQNLNNVVLGFDIAFHADPDITLNFIGEGSYLEELKALVKERKILNVFFWGRRPYAEMEKYYQSSDFLIISLNPDPVYDLYIPAKFQSYLQTGKPIFAIMNGQVPELVNRDNLGIVANPGDVEDIAIKFGCCVQLTSEDLELIRANSQKLLNNEFERSKIIKELTALLVL